MFPIRNKAVVIMLLCFLYVTRQTNGVQINKRVVNSHVCNLAFVSGRRREGIGKASGRHREGIGKACKVLELS